MALKNKKGIIIWACIVIGFIAVSGIYAAFNHDSQRSKKGSLFADNIAVLYVEGVISRSSSGSFGSQSGYNHSWTISQIDTLIDDNRNKGLVLFIDSPGGGIYETDELYLKVLDYKKKTGRPVYTAMGSMAASGGYYLSTASDKIFANRNTLTGSIGVTMGTYYDISPFLAEHGIKTVTITAGKNKAMGEITAPLTEEQRAIFRSIITEAYDQFVSVVSEKRHIDINNMRKIADGRIYTAKQANALHLVDQIGTLDETVYAMKRDYHLERCEVVDYYYESNSILSALTGLAKLASPSAKGDIAAVIDMIKSKDPSPVGYYCNILMN